METQSRTEIMTSCLHASLFSSDHCTNAGFLGIKFFQEQAWYRVIIAFIWCAWVDLAGMADGDTTCCPNSRDTCGRPHFTARRLNPNCGWFQVVITQGCKMGWVRPISSLPASGTSGDGICSDELVLYRTNFPCFFKGPSERSNHNSVAPAALGTKTLH